MKTSPKKQFSINTAQKANRLLVSRCCENFAMSRCSAFVPKTRDELSIAFNEAARESFKNSK